MIKNIIASRYSVALVNAFSDNELKALEKEVDFFVRFLHDNSEIEEFFLSPVIDDKIKKDVLDKLAEGLEISQKFHNFLKVLIDKDRIYFLQDICKEIIRRIHGRLNIQDLELVTARPISNEIVGKIRNFVSKYVSGEIHFTHRIDKRIKGGFIAYNENLAVNASIENNLVNIEREF
ncbi:MAG: ATP synthase F1 subunit delta [Candidatus Cloacimonetes bacterium]|nr:ATP synthase F1 subunit delta [Candidatus Cloacimonadota bacterium]